MSVIEGWIFVLHLKHENDVWFGFFSSIFLTHFIHAHFLITFNIDNNYFSIDDLPKKWIIFKISHQWTKHVVFLRFALRKSFSTSHEENNLYQKKKNGVLTTNNKLHTLQNQLFGATQNLQKYLIIKPVLTLFKTVWWVSAYRKEYYTKIFFFAFVCELEIFPLCCCVRQESFSSHQYTLNDGFVSLNVIGAISIDSLTSTTRWHCYLTG